MPPPRLIDLPEEPLERDGAEIERDREILGRLGETLRPPPRETLGAELLTRDELSDLEALREKPPRDDVDRETRESALEAVSRERLTRPELAVERDRATESPPRLDGLTREAERDANRPAERPWSAREARAEVDELPEPNGVKPLSFEPRNSDRERFRLERLLDPPRSLEPDGAERGALRSADGARLGAERCCELGAERCCWTGAERCCRTEGARSTREAPERDESEDPRLRVAELPESDLEGLTRSTLLGRSLRELERSTRELEPAPDGARLGALSAVRPPLPALPNRLQSLPRALSASVDRERTPPREPPPGSDADGLVTAVRRFASREPVVPEPATPARPTALPERSSRRVRPESTEEVDPRTPAPPVAGDRPLALSVRAIRPWDPAAPLVPAARRPLLSA